MRKLSLLALCMLLPFLGMTQKGEQKKENKPKERIEFIYFHRTQRCISCNAIENIVKSTIENDYKRDFKKGRLSMKSIDFQKRADGKLVKKYDVKAPKLLLVYHKKNGEKEIKDLTTQGFANAKTNPKKFEKIVKSEINYFFR